MLGRTIVSCVVERPASTWASAVVTRREVGVIAGTRRMGFGRLLAAFDDEIDGTVSVPETKLPGAADHLLLPVSHTSMVLSAEVARQTAAFLKDGRFSRA
mgnify:CR=1 FL=1